MIKKIFFFILLCNIVYCQDIISPVYNWNGTTLKVAFENYKFEFEYQFIPSLSGSPSINKIKIKVNNNLCSEFNYINSGSTWLNHSFYYMRTLMLIDVYVTEHYVGSTLINQPEQLKITIHK